MSDRLSRRDFLKLAGVTMSTAALGPFGRLTNRLEQAGARIGQEEAFETENARFMPFFEDHTVDSETLDQRILDAKPDILFIEFMSKTSNQLKRPPWDILNSEGVVWGSLNPGNRPDANNTIDTGRFLSPKLLDGLKQMGAKVSIEGVDIPPELVNDFEIINMCENTLTGISTLTSLGFALARLAKEGKFSKGDYTRIYLSALASMWANSDKFAGLAVLKSYGDENSKAFSDAQKIARRIYATVSFAHPENVIVFLRNILMASKLITLAEQSSVGSGEKPEIAFRAGAAHGAASDLVRLGKRTCLAMLDVYPASVLKKIVEYNTSKDKTLEEQIEEFCTVIVISVREAMEYNTGTRYVTDNELKGYLTRRLVEPQK